MSARAAPAARLVRLGCAGWTLPAAVRDQFPEGPRHLQRYSQILNASEINSSFHRPHRRATYERWAQEVTPGFRFSVKLPKAITHVHKLAGSEEPLREFFGQCAGLGDRLGCVLVQLPPSLAFDAGLADTFFAQLSAQHHGPVALEARHASWFDSKVEAWLAQRKVARVLADPVRHEGGRHPGGWPGLVYLRLHGSPRTYYSSYDEDLLQELATRIRRALEEAQQVWCIFDNTAGQAAAGNALRLRELLDQT